MSEMRYDANKPSEFYDPADFAALKNSNIPATIAASPAMRFDSEDAAAVFFARDLDYIKSKTYDKQYPEFTALQMFPVTHEVPEGAESFTYYGYEGKWYECKSCQLWDHTILSHYESEFVEMSPGSEGIGPPELEVSR